MRWKRSKPPTHGQERVIKKFLLIPSSLGSSQYRWCEFAYILQVWMPEYWEGTGSWDSIRWATKEEYDKYQAIDQYDWTN